MTRLPPRSAEYLRRFYAQWETAFGLNPMLALREGLIRANMTTMNTSNDEMLASLARGLGCKSVS